MIVLPAIDLRGGRCVRLVEGDFARETVFGDDPVAMAARWEAEGGRWLHLVDLDGAREGRPVQLDCVRRICERISIPVELGGGLRSVADVRAAVEAGVTRVILGTSALEEPEVLEAAASELPERVYVALDARDGVVATRGWLESSGAPVDKAAAACEARGAAGFLFTDISRDGTGRGVDVAAVVALAARVSVPVVASGGVSSLDDVRKLREVEASGVDSVIIGRALYTGAVRLAEAIAIAGPQP